MRLRRTLAPLLAALAATTSLLLGAPAQAAPIPVTVPAVAVSVADACSADDNPGEIATNFISRCRKASIRQVFPGEHYGKSLGDIKNCGESSCRTAWKLLNDNRFKK
jgi:hypothetical protein